MGWSLEPGFVRTDAMSFQDNERSRNVEERLRTNVVCERGARIVSERMVSQTRQAFTERIGTYPERIGT